jgi:hypothetical protein
MDQRPDQPSPNEKRPPDAEREHNAVTLLLTILLALIILGAVSYGIANTPQVTAAIPSPATHR